MKKAFFLDVETTGLDPSANGIVELAFIVEIDGIVKQEVQLLMQPRPSDLINEEALAINGRTLEEIRKFQPAEEAFSKLLTILDSWIDKYDGEDKFYPIGYNVRFDVEFLKAFFEKMGNRFYGSYFNWKLLDPIHLLYLADYQGLIKLPNYKLATVCEYFGIKIEAHKAVSDIEATRQLFKKITANPIPLAS